MSRRMGRRETFEYSRWGDRDNQGFRLVSFGGIVEEERTFGGYTIPTRSENWLVFWRRSRTRKRGNFFG